MSFFDNLDKILVKQQELSDRLASGIMGEAFIKASKEYSDLEPIVEQINCYKAAVNSLRDVEELIAQETDKEMKELAEQERLQLEDDIPKFELAVKLALLPKDEADKKNAIVEIRAGTGGEEAALFAGVLLRMYQRYSEMKKWKFEILSLAETGIGGYKEVSLLISGNGVFSRLKFESGVHRVQRVPETESSGRIHTSAATVAVLPEAEEVDVKIEEKDIRVDTYRSSGAGGQHVNTTDSAVRITHLPTGIVVTQQDERSQIKNRAKAMKILMSRIYEVERERKQQERSASRKGQIGSGDRSERIRTYNFPQGRVTDHRINMTHYRIEDVINAGEIDDFIDSLISQDEANKIAEEIN